MIRTPGLAQEVLRDLEPFLLEDGIDLSNLEEIDADTLNAAFGRAVARYNQSLPGVGSSSAVASPSPFVRVSGSHPPEASEVGGVTSLVSRRQSRPGFAGPASGRREAARSDRMLRREFERWLRRQPGAMTPSPEEGGYLFGDLLAGAEGSGIDLRTPRGVLDMVDLLMSVDDLEQAEYIDAALATLHDYVHYRIETESDPREWEEACDLLNRLTGEEFPGAQIIQDAITEASMMDPEELRAAYAQTRLVAAVPELLSWIGSGRKVTPSGVLQRADIEFGAGLLGIDAAGVDKRPAWDPDSSPMLWLEDSPPARNSWKVRSMRELPLLPAWWGALSSAGVIDVGKYRVTAGPGAPEWTPTSGPPIDAAEMVVGLTVAQFACRVLTSNPFIFAEPVAQMTIHRLIETLAPGKTEPWVARDRWDGMLQGRVEADLRLLEGVGVLVTDEQGDLVVPVGLRGAVARGIMAAWVILTSNLG